MVIGYFDPSQAYARDIAVDRPLNRVMVHQLQAVCDELFAVQIRLHDFLTDDGTLVIVDGVITGEMFQIACVAHEQFGMIAVDNAHRGEVYPRPDWDSEPLDSLIAEYHEMRPDWDEGQLHQNAESHYKHMASLAKFEREVIQRVRAALEHKGFTPGADSM
jgi:hypothetical protein